MTMMVIMVTAVIIIMIRIIIMTMITIIMDWRVGYTHPDAGIRLWLHFIRILT